MRKYQCKMCPQVIIVFLYLCPWVIIVFVFVPSGNYFCINKQAIKKGQSSWFFLETYIFQTKKEMAYTCLFKIIFFLLKISFVPILSRRNANIWVKDVATTPGRQQSPLMSVPHALWENNWFGLILKWMANTLLIIYRFAHLMVTCVTRTVTAGKKKMFRIPIT